MEEKSGLNTTASLDSFQLVIGLYLIYAAVKGSGTLYNFFDLSEKDQARCQPILRIVYGVCGLIALAEACICIYRASAGASSDTISLVMTGIIVLILVCTFVWLRRLAHKNH